MKFKQFIVNFALVIAIFNLVVFLPLRSVGSEFQKSDPIVYWASTESNARFERAQKNDFYGLVPYFESQINKFYCGPASAVVVLNALLMHTGFSGFPTEAGLYAGDTEKFSQMSKLGIIPKGFVPVFERFTQNTFFNKDTEKIKTREQVFAQDSRSLIDPAKAIPGLTIRNLSDMLGALRFGGQPIIKTELVIVHNNLNKNRKEEIKRALIANMSNNADFVIVNYSRASLGQKGGGHISPVGAYDAQTDSFLIMDVNPIQSKWAWVRYEDLLSAMMTKDVNENRGFIALRRATN